MWQSFSRPLGIWLGVHRFTESMRKRFGFVTCVQLGLSCMEKIYEVGGTLDLVITLQDDQAPTKSGRIYPDAFCEQHGIALIKVRNVNDAEALEAIHHYGIDWLFIIGWSQIAKKPVLDAPRLGALGMHPTLLPRGRGRAAIPWAILKGLDETGVTLFKLDEGVDTGPIVAQVRLPLAPDETATSLYTRVMEAHQTLIAETWDDLVHNRVKVTPQNDAEATYWPQRKPEDGRIASDMSVKEVDRLVRAVTHPYPGAYLERKDDVLRIWAGYPATDANAPDDVAQISLRDGFFHITAYDIEPK